MQSRRCWNSRIPLAAEYRALAASLPIEALLGGTLSDEAHQDALDEFYHYSVLRNGQNFLRRKGRVSKPKFSFWCNGIKAHLTRPAFARAWADINTRLPNDFKDLRRLIEAQYQGDPKDWDRTLSYAR